MKLGVVIFLIFLILKICKLISWSWWWVTSPIWLSIVINIIVTIVVEKYNNKGRKYERNKK